MHDLRVVLKTVDAARRALDGDDCPLFAASDAGEAFWKDDCFIPVAHPYKLRLGCLIGINSGVLDGDDGHASIFATALCCFDFATERVNDKLHSVADAKDRDGLFLAVFKEACRQARCSLYMYRIGASGEDDEFGV